MKTTKAFELEIMRHNVTPAQFLAYVRQQTKRKGISFDMSSADFTREGWSFGYMNALPSEKPCNAETGTDKPYNKHTYIRNFDGTTYNEIIEFQFDDDKTGFGYYYTVQIDVADEDREANTAETIAHTIANRAKKAEAQEARAAKIEAEADEAEARGYAAQWWIEAQRTEAAKLRREAAATREAITASNAQATAEAPETSEETESEEQTTTATEAAEEHATTAHPVPAKLAREYDARTYTNRDKWQRCRLPEWGGLCNSISWRYYHGAGTPRT